MEPTCRYAIVRKLAVIATFAVGAAACGSSGDSQPASDTVLPTRASTTTEGSTTTSISATSPVTPSTTEPGARPVTTKAIDGAQAEPQTPPSSGPERLSIEDSLLPDDAFASPWEVQRRNLDRIGFGAGPNQTDCDAYWQYESLLGLDGGHVMWWVDGGNANHQVGRLADEMAILTTALAITTMSIDCPVVTWNEGGSFTTEMFAFDDSIGFRFVDAASGEVTWTAVTTLGDLVSVVHIPLWTRADGTMIDFGADDLEAVSSRMYDQLEQAGPAADSPVDQPTISPPTTAEPPIIVAATTTSIATIPDSGLGAMLLADGDLGGEWQLTGVEEYRPAGPDNELVAACPAAESIDRIDALLSWEAEWRDVSGAEAFELIGQASTADDVAAVVEQFAGMATCDPDALIPGGTMSGGKIALGSGRAAATLVMRVPEDGEFGLLIAAVGPTVVVVSVEVGPGGAAEETIVFIADAAVEKIIAATG